jgi:hypothetical protein
MLREKSKWKRHKDQSTDAEHRGGATRSSYEGSLMGLERSWPTFCYSIVDRAETPDQYAFFRASRPPFWLSGNPASYNNFGFYALGLAQKNRRSDNRRVLP